MNEKIVSPPLLVLLMLLAVPSGAMARMYSWIDDNGKRQYSDRLPPAAVRRERRVYDDTGRLLQVLEAARTQEEIEADERRKAEQDRLAARRAEQERKDRVLLVTFTSVEDIEAARDERLAIIDSSIALSGKKLGELKRKLSHFETQVRAANEADKAPSTALRKNLSVTRERLAATSRDLRAKRLERLRTEEKFNRDIARYRQLKAERTASSR